MTGGFGVVGVSQRIDALQKAVAEVAEIHKPAGEYVHRCQVCNVPYYPCNTRRVIEAALVAQDAV